MVDCLSLEEYRTDFEDAPSLPVVDGIDFYNVPFSRFHELIGIIHMYEYGIRLSDGTVVLWIDGSGRRQAISSPADLPHHRAYRSVHGGSSVYVLTEL